VVFFKNPLNHKTSSQETDLYISSSFPFIKLDQFVEAILKKCLRITKSDKNKNKGKTPCFL
jgi:hypothetical protein